MEEFESALAKMGLGVEIEVPKCLGKPLVPEKLKKFRKPMMRITSFTGFMEAIASQFCPQRSFDELRGEMTDIGNGIWKKTLEEGFGDVVKENTKITVQYTMFFENDTNVLDSTYSAEEAFTFVLGRQSGILPGFERSIRTMRNQEKAEFIVPRLISPENGRSLSEDERKTGYLVIEVLRVSEVMAKAEKVRLLNNFPLALNYVQKLREKGKVAFAAGFNSIAADEYIEAVFVLRNILVQSSADNEKRLDLLLRMYLYAGMTFNKMEEPKLAYEMLRDAVNMLENDFNAVPMLKGKIYLHTSRALRLKNNFFKAYVYLRDARMYLGEVQVIKDEFKKISQAFDHHMISMASVATLYEAFDETHGDISYCLRSHELIEESFQQVMKTFMSSKNKEMTVYGMHCPGNIHVVEHVVSDYKKVKIDVSIDRDDFVRYILTKKVKK